MDVDTAAELGRTQVSEFDDFFDPRHGVVLRVGLERTATQHQRILDVVLRFYFEAITVQRETLHDDVLQQLRSLKRGLFGIFKKAEGAFV